MSIMPSFPDPKPHTLACGQEASVSLLALQREIDLIGQYVGALRSAINGLRAPELVGQKLPTVRDDLGAILSSTRQAAEAVLGTAEDVLACSADGTDYRSFVDARMIGLIEACSFQDLTGQRMTRVIDALLALEHRLHDFVATARARDGAAGLADLETRQAQRCRDRLTHGPGAPDAMEQAAIDALLAG